MNTIRIKILLAVAFLVMPFLNSQSLDIDQFEKLLDERSQSGIFNEEEKSYESFTQNQLSNIMSKQELVDEKLKQDLYLKELNQDRIELASQLCSRDKRACYLIEEYHDYQNTKISPSSLDELELYGVDIFSGYPLTFDQQSDTSIKSNYVLKVGDRLRIFSYGLTKIDEVTTILSSGELIIPGYGPINIAGMTLSDANQAVNDFAQSKEIGAEVFLITEQLTTNQVYILGNAANPGAYNLGVMSSPLNALVASGGFNRNSSLRSIKVFRGKSLLNEIDLYELLVEGKTIDDVRIQSGDSILITGLGDSIKVFGEVIRPAIYELKPGETLNHALDFALGFTPLADKKNITINRLDKFGNFFSIEVSNKLNFKLQNGDQIIVNKIDGEALNNIELAGAIRKSGTFQHKDNKTLGDLISIVHDLRDDTYVGFGVIKRFNIRTRTWSAFSFNLLNQDVLNNISLEPKDKIYIFSKDDIDLINAVSLNELIDLNITPKMISDIRQKEMEFIKSDELNFSNPESLSCLEYVMNQDSSNIVIDNFSKKLDVVSRNVSLDCTPLLSASPDLLPILIINSVPVLGNVRFPGLYPATGISNANDFVSMAGGPLRSDEGSEVDSNFFESGDIAYVNVQYDETIGEQNYIFLMGEFNAPGRYTFKKGDTVGSIIAKAGGLTSHAYPVAGIMTRNSIKERERAAIQRARQELSEIIGSAVTSGYMSQSSTDLVSLVSLMTQLSEVEPVGRIVTELNPYNLQSNPDLDLILQNGDMIYMPRIQNTITVSGQVLNPVTVPYSSKLNTREYINLAGGFKDNADKGNIYALLPNGKSVRLKSNSFNLFQSSGGFLPGTTIIVPRKARPLDSLALVETVTPIIASLSITAASIAAINNN